MKEKRSKALRSYQYQESVKILNIQKFFLMLHWESVEHSTKERERSLWCISFTKAKNVFFAHKRTFVRQSSAEKPYQSSIPTNDNDWE